MAPDQDQLLACTITDRGDGPDCPGLALVLLYHEGPDAIRQGRRQGEFMLVKNILAHKGPGVATVLPSATIKDAVAELGDRGVGALVVSTDGRTISGILSERDIVRALHRCGPGLLTMTVGDIMTTDVHTCVPTDEVRSVARTMTERRFRHMPVTVDGELSGIVSIGDLVKSRIDELETEHDQLLEYISSAG
jgi:CBS domain-containing protein